MRLIFKLFILGCLLSFQQTSASDFGKIYDRMYYDYLSNPSKSAVEAILKNVTPTGAFGDINYQTTEATPRKHVQNMIVLAAAYKNPENPFYMKENVKETYLRTLAFWVNTNHQAGNWWYRYIAYPKELSKSVVLMADEIKTDKSLFDNTMQYLQWSYNSAEPRRLTGANGADIIMGAITASILTENDAQMMLYKNKMTELLSIQPVEGIQPDYLFAQHCGSGRQLYFCSYGKEFVNSVMYYLEFCNGTKYQTPGVDLLQDLFVNGVQWVIYNKHYDPNNAGRYNSTDQYYAQIKSLSDRLQKLKVSKKADVQLMGKRIGGDNTLAGNRMFWRFDYMVHRRASFLVSSRMTSTRTVGNEAGNGDGEYNYYAANGVNYLMVSGKEYDRNYFKKFNNRQFPGITAEQDNEKLPVPNWGENGTNGNSFAGGVSDSTYGACAMILERRELKAHKAWFYFDNEYVCLGAGIQQNNGKADVYTTINQINVDGKLLYSLGGKVETAKTDISLQSPLWMMYGGTTYINMADKADIKVTLDTAVFALNINHGTNPQNQCYAYLVRPAMTNTDEADRLVKNNPVKILENTKEIQAVMHRQLQVLEVVFYKAGTLQLSADESISVDVPCVLMWNKATNKLHLANPNCESTHPQQVIVMLSANGQHKEYQLKLPQNEFSGRSVAIDLSK